MGVQRDKEWAKTDQGRGEDRKRPLFSVEMALRNQILTVREQALLNLGQGCVGVAVGMAGCLGSGVDAGSGRRETDSWKDALRIRDSKVQMVSPYPGCAWACHSVSAVPQSP